MSSDTKNVKLGVCSVSFDNVNLGYTQGGVEVTVTTQTHPVNVDQFGKTTINEYIMQREVKVKCPLAETTLDNLVNIMPGATLVTDGAKATGTITVATLPTTGQTITVNGATVTFKTAGIATGPLDVAIGGVEGSLTAVQTTARNLAAVLELSTNLLLNPAEYTNTAATAIVNVTYDARGTAGNAFTLVTGTAGASVTMSSATLSGGTAVSKARVDVTTGIGNNLLSAAKLLVLHPTGVADNDRSEDFGVYLAATAGQLQFAYTVDKERTFPVEFTGYPDPVTGKLFYLGDPAAV